LITSIQNQQLRQRKANASGGLNAPRRPNGNIDWEVAFTQYIHPIIQNQIAPNTNRGIMYICESKGVLKKSDYTQLCSHLVDWRKDSRISWSDIADGSGRGVHNDFRDFVDVGDYVKSVVNSFVNCGDNYQQWLNEEWRWYGQPHYAEIWSEKHAVVGTIAAHIKGTYVKVAFNRGNPGWGYMHDNYERLEKELWYYDLETRNWKQREGVHVWYLGDDDKYGRDMDRQIEEQLDFFGLLDKPNFEFKRIAIIPSQIKEFGLKKDFESGKGYEIDALNAFNQQLFRKLLLDHITPYFDLDIHEQLLEEYSADSTNSLVKERLRQLDWRYD